MKLQQFFGYLLMITGGLVAAVAGPCTVMFGGIGLMGFIGTGGREGGEYVGAALMMGGIPLALGLLALYFGIKLVAKPKPDPQSDD